MIVYVEGKRYNTTGMAELISKQRAEGHGQGITLEGAWKTASGKILVVTYSIWASSHNDGTNVGRRAHFAESDEIAMLAERYGGPIEELVPFGERYFERRNDYQRAYLSPWNYDVGLEPWERQGYERE